MRTFFIWEGVTQYLSEEAVRATLEALRGAPSAADWCSPTCSRDFIDGVNMYGAAIAVSSVSASGGRCGVSD